MSTNNEHQDVPGQLVTTMSNLYLVTVIMNGVDFFPSDKVLSETIGPAHLARFSACFLDQTQCAGVGEPIIERRDSHDFS